jgi:hypothetical protein
VPGACVDCHRLGRIAAFGHCPRCYERHRQGRPYGPHENVAPGARHAAGWRRAQRATRACVDCGRVGDHHAFGRCTPCYHRHRKQAAKRRCTACDQLGNLWPGTEVCGRCHRRARPRRPPGRPRPSCVRPAVSCGSTTASAAATAARPPTRPTRSSTPRGWRCACSARGSRRRPGLPASPSMWPPAGHRPQPPSCYGASAASCAPGSSSPPPSWPPPAPVGSAAARWHGRWSRSSVTPTCWRRASTPARSLETSGPDALPRSPPCSGRWWPASTPPSSPPSSGRPAPEPARAPTAPWNSTWPQSATWPASLPPTDPPSPAGSRSKRPTSRPTWPR